MNVATPVVVETASINNEGGNMATSAIVEAVFINSEGGNNNNNGMHMVKVAPINGDGNNVAYFVASFKIALRSSQQDVLILV